MNGELASVMSLVLNANKWLATVAETTGEDAPDLLQSSSAMKFEKSVVFALPEVQPGRRTVIDGTAAWFEHLRETGVSRLWLIEPGFWGADESGTPGWIAAAFANGAPWTVLTTGAGTGLWDGRWFVGDGSDPDHRIWNVEFRGTTLSRVVLPQTIGLVAAREELRQALSDARIFADIHGQPNWSAWFTKAEACLADPEPVLPYNPDLAPPGVLDLDQRQLLAAAMQAWVFGGMGSWNDISFAGDDETTLYNLISENLYEAVIHTFTAVVNEPAITLA